MLSQSRGYRGRLAKSSPICRNRAPALPARHAAEGVSDERNMQGGLRTGEETECAKKVHSLTVAHFPTINLTTGARKLTQKPRGLFLRCPGLGRGIRVIPTKKYKSYYSYIIEPIMSTTR